MHVSTRTERIAVFSISEMQGENFAIKMDRNRATGDVIDTHSDSFLFPAHIDVLV
jgi:hypothetical protein